MAINPQPETYPQRLAGAHCYAVLDLTNSFWLLPYDEESSALAVIQTSRGTWRSKRVLQGTQDGVTAMQASLFWALGSLERYVLINVDDCCVFAETEVELVDRLLLVLACLHKHNFKVNPRKLHLFTTELVFCGRRYTPKGVTFNPDWISGLLNQPCKRSCSSCAAPTGCA